MRIEASIRAVIGRAASHIWQVRHPNGTSGNYGTRVAPRLIQSFRCNGACPALKQDDSCDEACSNIVRPFMPAHGGEPTAAASAQLQRTGDPPSRSRARAAGWHGFDLLQLCGHGRQAAVAQGYLSAESQCEGVGSVLPDEDERISSRECSPSVGELANDSEKSFGRAAAKSSVRARFVLRNRRFDRGSGLLLHARLAPARIGVQSEVHRTSAPARLSPLWRPARPSSICGAECPRDLPRRLGQALGERVGRPG